MTSSLYGTSYTDIIRAILEAEDRSGQSLGELAFAIFLLGRNYDLSPRDYQNLLGRGSSQLQSALHAIAREHVLSYLHSCRDGIPT